MHGPWLSARMAPQMPQSGIGSRTPARQGRQRHDQPPLSVCSHAWPAAHVLQAPGQRPIPTWTMPPRAVAHQHAGNKPPSHHAQGAPLHGPAHNTVKRGCHQRPQQRQHQRQNGQLNQQRDALANKVRVPALGQKRLEQREVERGLQPWTHVRVVFPRHGRFWLDTRFGQVERNNLALFVRVVGPIQRTRRPCARCPTQPHTAWQFPPRFQHGPWPPGRHHPPNPWTMQKGVATRGAWSLTGAGIAYAHVTGALGRSSCPGCALCGTCRVARFTHSVWSRHSGSCQRRVRPSAVPAPAGAPAADHPPLQHGSEDPCGLRLPHGADALWACPPPGRGTRRVPRLETASLQ